MKSENNYDEKNFIYGRKGIFILFNVFSEGSVEVSACLIFVKFGGNHFMLFYKLWRVYVFIVRFMCCLFGF